MTQVVCEISGAPASFSTPSILHCSIPCPATPLLPNMQGVCCTLSLLRQATPHGTLRYHQSQRCVIRMRVSITQLYVSVCVTCQGGCGLLVAVSVSYRKA